MTRSASLDLTHFDVRTIPCRVKHAQIFQRWTDLPVGEHFVLINDHDPVPLYYQFAAQFPGAFDWEYLTCTADEFRVKITRLLPTPAAAIAPPPRPAAEIAPPAVAVDVDARGLEPPEPMLRILQAAEALPRGATLQALTDRRPVHLLPELESRGFHAECTLRSDGSCLTVLRRA